MNDRTPTLADIRNPWIRRGLVMLATPLLILILFTVALLESVVRGLVQGLLTGVNNGADVFERDARLTGWAIRTAWAGPDALEEAAGDPVVRLDDYMPHITLAVTEHRADVIPVKLVQAWATGEQPIPQDQAMIRAIIGDWLRSLRGD